MRAKDRWETLTRRSLCTAPAPDRIGACLSCLPNAFLPSVWLLPSRVDELVGRHGVDDMTAIDGNTLRRMRERATESECTVQRSAAQRSAVGGRESAVAAVVPSSANGTEPNCKCHTIVLV